MTVHWECRRLGIVMLILALVLAVAVAMFLRFIFFVAQHGGGMPHIRVDGKTVLNNHGRIKEVTPAVYLEAVHRWRSAIAVGLISIGIFIIVLLTYLCRSRTFRPWHALG